MLKLSLDEERLIVKALMYMFCCNESEEEILKLYQKMMLHIDEVERMMAECELK